MPERTIKIPGPEHPITIARNQNRVVVTLGGHVIADTREALTLREASYPPVQYIPRRDVDMAALARTATRPSARTRARPRTSAFRPAANGRWTRSGPMKRPTTPWPRSRITSPSTPTA